MKSLIGLRIARGFCNGYFGRDNDQEGAVVEAAGRDWVLIRLVDGTVRCKQFNWPRRDIKAAIREWATPEPEEAAPTYELKEEAVTE
ncbi:MAG: hypothetical protein ACRYFX_18620 [Janthinobacterium lividum]